MGGGTGAFGVLFSLVLLVDLILLGVWLWQRVTSK